MAAKTDTQLVELYKEALEAVAVGQSYTIGGRVLTRASLSEIRKTIEWLERRIRRQTGSDIHLATFKDPV